MKRNYWLFLLILLFVLPVGPTAAQDASPPAETEEHRVRMGRATWDTGWFQAEVFKQLLQQLGYTVDGPRTYTNEGFYTAAASGEVDLWVNGWFPLHNTFLNRDEIAEQVEPVGYEVQGGSLQGYLVDRATADALDITSLEDFTRPDVINAFDPDGDGRANLIGCNEGWGCEAIVEHHLDAYNLRPTVEHVQGDYGPLMVNTIQQYEQGQPVFFYTWTPNWTLGRLVPGDDVVWIGVPFPSLPDEITTPEAVTVPGIVGCVADPCPLGFPPNDIRAVANREFLAANPAVRVLLEAVTIPLSDITDQNARLLNGEDSSDDIVAHAAEWIDNHRPLVQDWLRSARTADPGLVAVTDATEITAETMNPAAAAATPPEMTADSLQIATKTFEPFVIYNVEDRRYTGFSIELWRLVAEEVGIEYELYGVNSIAKLLDEVERGAADVVAAGIGITSRREVFLDFSHPYFESGLQIMVPHRDNGLWGDGLRTLAAVIFSPQLGEALGFLLVVLLIVSHVLWWYEKDTDGDFAEAYWPGIWDAFWWSAVTATTVGYGDKTPRTAIGRIVALVWMFSGLFVLASFTAGIATTFTLNEIEGRINGPGDLIGHDVATIRRSTAADYLMRQGIQAELFEREEQAYAALLEGEVDAVVYDAPVLQHYAAHEGAGQVQLVGNVFQEQMYGIAFPHQSEYREEINQALLHLIETGEYQRLYDEWFGDSGSGG